MLGERRFQKTLWEKMENSFGTDEDSKHIIHNTHFYADWLIFVNTRNEDRHIDLPARPHFHCHTEMNQSYCVINSNHPIKLLITSWTYDTRKIMVPCNIEPEGITILCFSLKKNNSR